MPNEDKATRYHRLQRRASILATVLTTTVLALVLVTGASAALRDVVVSWFGQSFVVTVIGYVVVLGIVLELVGLPLAFYRGVTHERRADRYALTITGNAPAFITAMKRLGAQNLAEEEPSRLVEILFHTHPTIHARIAAAREHASRAQTNR